MPKKKDSVTFDTDEEIDLFDDVLPLAKHSSDAGETVIEPRKPKDWEPHHELPKPEPEAPVDE